MITLYTMERDYPYGTLRSTNGSKTKVVLEEKGLAYQVETVSPGAVWKKLPEILAKHPLGKVPWIEDGDLVIYDSTVINEYLNEKSENNPLLAREPAKRARARALENYADEGVLSKLLPLIWMPWWSAEEQRDADSMEKGRQGLRDQIFPFLDLNFYTPDDKYQLKEQSKRNLRDVHRFRVSFLTYRFFLREDLYNGKNLGCEELKKAVCKFKPAVHVFGHTHVA